MKTLRETILKNSWQEDMVGPHLVRVDDALSALRQWMEDEGLAIVPRETTYEMMLHGQHEMESAEDPNSDGGYASDIYRAMIAAAPDALRKGE